MAVGVAPLRQRLRYLDRPERTHVAVVIAALGDRIDVGAEQNGERPRLRAGSGADDVAGGIDPRVEARLTHPLHREGPPLDVGLAEGDPAHAAPRISPRTPKIGEVLVEAPSVDAPALPVGGLGEVRVGQPGQDPPRPAAPDLPP